MSIYIDSMGAFYIAGSILTLAIAILAYATVKDKKTKKNKKAEK